jgi:predicted secreted protein
MQFLELETASANTNEIKKVIIETIAMMLIFLLFFLLLSISVDFSYP